MALTILHGQASIYFIRYIPYIIYIYIYIYCTCNENRERILKFTSAGAEACVISESLRTESELVELDIDCTLDREKLNRFDHAWAAANDIDAKRECRFFFDTTRGLVPARDRTSKSWEDPTTPALGGKPALPRDNKGDARERLLGDAMFESIEPTGGSDISLLAVSTDENDAEERECWLFSISLS